MSKNSLPFLSLYVSLDLRETVHRASSCLTYSLLSLEGADVLLSKEGSEWLDLQSWPWGLVFSAFPPCLIPSTL